MEIALSIVAIVLSGLSLAWQAYTWKRSAPRPRVEGSLRMPDGKRAELIVSVRNRGGAACQIVRIDLQSTTHTNIMGLTSSSLDGKELPMQLDARNGAELKFDAAKLASALHHHQGLSDRYAIVATLGDGTRVRSTGSLNLVDCLIPGEDPLPGEHKVRIVKVVGTSKDVERKPLPKKPR
jgi:hypothetical protein